MTNKQLNLGTDLENIDPVDELRYEPLEIKFINVQFIGAIISYLFFLALPFLLLLTEGFNYRTHVIIGAEFVILVTAVINLWLLPKAYAYKGFAIREHDITYRSGIIFPSIVTIPFCKIQQVSIQQSPIARIFGLYSVDVVNGAQLLSETNIPGLSQERANQLKELLTAKITSKK